VTTLAALRGHADVLRVLVEKWPTGDRGEALAVAICMGHDACAAVLRETRCAIACRVVRLMHRLPNRALQRMAMWFGRSGGIGGQRSMWNGTLSEGVRAMVGYAGAPTEW
jgi:hypothetical protein